MDNDISYEFPVLLEKSVTELELASFGKALAPERFVIAKLDTLRRGDAAALEQGIDLVAVIDDDAPDAAPSPLLVSHVFCAVIRRIRDLKSDDACFCAAGVFRARDNMKNIL